MSRKPHNAAPGDLSAVAREIIDSNGYMTLATADADGRPWASPVWYAHAGYRHFLWVSVPEARHSRNLASRPQLGIVIFDSRAPINTGQGVYMDAEAEELGAQAAEEALATYSARALRHGGEGWGLADVSAPARLRLYRATAREQFVLDERDRRVAVTLG